ncbi:hypothetical protein [Streptomyces sp. AK02-04a]|uniref:hypothetical protein n=1 Tax=Streptomyces sp. AK02-04a TaxID=3028649 RepID=UPI0029BC2D25|nr:hypothetical protein [Streptomyces sp. AK02-04a]MDX3759283.1 hypothetical protein [Streptomyces sp. AK02-04a]
MTCQTSTSDVVACLSLAVGVFSASLVPFFLLIDADLADFDPRPAVRRVAAGPVWVAVRNTALDAAALVVLLTTSPKGAMA